MSVNRQHTVPVLIDSPEENSAHPLTPVPLTENLVDEGRLQELLATHPNLIPIDEIEPALGPLVFLGMEVPTDAGPLDVMYASPNGYLTLVETKLWRNPEARRAVVGQLIDYAKEVAKWSFDQLDNAVRKAQRTNNMTGSGVMELLANSGHEMEEADLIDSLTRNLQRGHFLLIVAGDGIRQDVESMAEYLQGTPSLHFTLALLELGLYRMNRNRDYPLLVQPRIVARTAEVVRAIVHVESGSTTEVTIPDGPKYNARKRRRTLTEDGFYEELCAQTDKSVTEAVRLLAEELAELGILPRYGASSVSFRYPDPRDTGQMFSLVLIYTHGKWAAGWLSRLKDSGYSFEIALQFLNMLCSGTGVEMNKRGDGTREQDVTRLLQWRDGLLEALNTLINQINEQAKDMARP